jgi:DNA-binding response OmpR family regulator
MLEAGMDAAVSKPFKMVELLSQIEALTGKRPGMALPARGEAQKGDDQTHS